MNRTIPALLAALGFATAAGAAEKPLETIPVDQAAASSLARDMALPYSYVGLGYLDTKYDDVDIGQDGFQLEGSFLLGGVLPQAPGFLATIVPRLFVTGAYYAGETDEAPGFTSIDVEQLNVGAGYRQPLSMTVDLVGSVEYVRAELDFGGVSDAETGFEVDLGIRGLLIDKLEGKGEVQFLEIGEASETYFNLQALYAVLPSAQVGLDFLKGDEQTTYGLMGRYSF